MRIFVTGTGRCGTTTFWHAAKHATNYVVGNESRVGNQAFRSVLSYPDWTIEVSPLLSFFAAALAKKYPNAKWVHVIRDKRECVRSFVESGFKWIGGYSNATILCDVDKFGNKEKRAAALSEMASAYYDSVNAMLHAVIPDAFVFRLENWPDDWPKCWEFMGCIGNYEASLLEWTRKYNPRENRGKKNWVPASEPLCGRKERAKVFLAMRKTGRGCRT